MPFPKGTVFTPLQERFWEKVNKTNSCWEWTAFVDKAGYGRIQKGGRSDPVLYAHRLSYELHVGPIPEGMSIDHLCGNRICVNPDHLEAVTLSVNTQRANPVTTHCKAGHERTPENTQYKSDGSLAFCKSCRRARRRADREAVHGAVL